MTTAEQDPEYRSALVRVRVKPSAKDAFVALCREHGVDVSDAVRWGMRRATEALKRDGNLP